MYIGNVVHRSNDDKIKIRGIVVSNRCVVAENMCDDAGQCPDSHALFSTLPSENAQTWSCNINALSHDNPNAINATLVLSIRRKSMVASANTFDSVPFFYQVCVVPQTDRSYTCGKSCLKAASIKK